MAIHQFDLKLNWTKLITPSVLHLAFLPTNGEKMTFVPGQFITFLFKLEDKLVRRSYSIASIPGQSEAIEIAVAPVAGGIATRILFGLKTNDVLNTSGPFGRLVLPETAHPKQYVLAATGTGVSPYRSMLPKIATILREAPETHFTLLLGVQYRHDLLYLEDFLGFAKQHERFKFRVYLSREATLTAAYEHKGYLQQAFSQLCLDAAQDVVYLCGNPNMIDASFALLTEAGFATSRIKREKYISAKI